MSRTYRVLLATACLILVVAMLGLVVCQGFFALSQTIAMIGFTGAFTALIAIGMLYNRRTHSTWFMHHSAQERAVFDSRVEHARRGHFIGSIVMLPAFIVMVEYGFEQSNASSAAVLVAATTAAGYFVRARTRPDL
jgi:hypothetical protein